MGLLHATEATSLWPLAATLAKAVLLLIGARLLFSLYEGYQVRMRFRKLKAQGIPILEHSFLWGHLKVLGRISSLYPKDAHRHYIQIHIVQHWREFFPSAEACPPIIYLDTWPMAEAMAVLVDPSMCQELVQERCAPRHAMIKHLVKYLCFGRSLTDWGGSLHRLWRSRLNPGFSAKNLQSHMDTFVEEVGIYADRLKAAAGQNGNWGRVVQLLPLTVDLTFDIIGRVALGIRLDEQTHGPTELQTSLRTMLLRHVMFRDLRTLPRRLNPLWRYEGWKCHRSFQKLLMPQIQKQVGAEQATTQKTVIQLATKELNNESGSIKGSSSSSAEYMRDVLCLTVQFLFAGHDTTATSITWAYHYLSQAPEVLERMRAEHDKVFGPDPAAARQAVLAAPALLNALPYTNAVIKEVLRLVPIAATAREGSPDLVFVGKDGARYPTDGFATITGTALLHYHPDHWPRVNEFVPERWLVPEGDPLYPTPYAWRPFEYGPMNCIGQEVAMIELRMTLLFTVREIDVECAWAQWDAMRGKTNEPPSTLNGDRAYRSVVGLSSPKDDLPVHIRLRSPKA